MNKEAQPPYLRIAELDGLRGLAVGMVLVWHFVGAIIDPQLGAWTRVVYHLTILGRTGVDLFFVLSGFLITGIILDRNKASRPFLFSFYVRRVLRILPSYLLLILVFWSVVAWGVNNEAFNAQTPLWQHLTFTQNWWMAAHERWGPGAISVTWSVAIEEQFYIVFPLLVLLTPPRRLPLLLGAIAACSILFRAFAYFHFDSVFTMYVHTLSRLDGLAAGAMVAWLWRHAEFQQWTHENQARMQKGLTFLYWGVPVLIVALAWNLAWTMAAWGHTYLTLLYAAVLVKLLLSMGSTELSWLRHSLLVRLGAISYSVYLFHPFFLACVFIAFNRPERISSPSDLALASLALTLTLAWCATSFRFVERPLTHAGRKLSY